MTRVHLTILPINLSKGIYTSPLMSEQNTTLKSLEQPSTEIYTYLPENNSIDIWTLTKNLEHFPP